MRAVLADPDAIEALHKAHGAYQSGELLKGEPVVALQEALIARGALEVEGALGMQTGAAAP
jgi:hypothetical protein